MKLTARDVIVRCVQRGYTWEEIRPCILRDYGGGWYEFDVNHPAYPAKPKPGHKAPESLSHAVAMAMPSVEPAGPGTELKKLLGKIGIKSSPTCSCNKRAKTMDENGIEWCEQNVETICDWLQEEATKRKLPFIRMAGKAIVHLAIRRAKKATNK